MSLWLEDRARVMLLATARENATQVDACARGQVEFVVPPVTATTLSVATMTRESRGQYYYLYGK